MHISVSQQAWENLKTIIKGTTRQRPDIALSDNQFVLVHHNTTIKGLSEYITNLLINKTPQVTSQYYSTTPPYFLLPEYFIDCRPWATTDYEAYGYPGQLPYAVGGSPTWNDDPEGRRPEIRNLSIMYAQSVLAATSNIATYWHLTLNARRPRSQQEQLSAMLNAIGLGLLHHPLLPRNWPPNPVQRINPTQVPPLPTIPPEPEAPYVTIPQQIVTPRLRTRTPLPMPSLCEACNTKQPTYKYAQPHTKTIKVYCSDCALAIQQIADICTESEKEYEEKLAKFKLGLLPFKPTLPFPRTPDLKNFTLTPLTRTNQCACNPPRIPTHKYTLIPENVDIYTCNVCLKQLTAELHPNQYTVTELTDASI